MLRDLMRLARHRSAALFLAFAALVGVLDGFLIYYLLWFLEDLAGAAAQPQLKLIEGLVVAAQTLGGEVLFFPLSGNSFVHFLTESSLISRYDARTF